MRLEMPKDIENAITVELSGTKNIVFTVDGKIVAHVTVEAPFELSADGGKNKYMHYSFVGRGIEERQEKEASQNKPYIYRLVSTFAGGSTLSLGIKENTPKPRRSGKVQCRECKVDVIVGKDGRMYCSNATCANSEERYNK